MQVSDAKGCSTDQIVSGLGACGVELITDHAVGDFRARNYVRKDSVEVGSKSAGVGVIAGGAARVQPGTQLGQAKRK